jgi:hypothetical protein
MRLLSRFRFMTLLAGAVSGCVASAPEVVTLDGEYVAQCSGTQPQCFTQQSPSHPRWIDSARVVFHNDGMASWMRALGDRVCPCYLTPPCTCDPPMSTLSRFDSSYSVTGALVRTAAVSSEGDSYDMVAAAPIKSPGPAELTVRFERTNTTVRFLRVR